MGQGCCSGQAIPSTSAWANTDNLIALWWEDLRPSGGGNIYYTFKLAIFDRRSMQYVGGAMSGVTEQEFMDMMIAGGRPAEGNRYTSEENNK